MTPEFAAPNDDARPIWLVQKDLHDNLPPPMQTWVKVTGFSGKAGQICLLPKSDGSIGGALIGVEKPSDRPSRERFALAKAALALPEGAWKVENWPEGVDRAFAKLDTIKQDIVW